MKPQRLQKFVATMMLAMSSTLMVATSGDVAFPSVLCLLGLVGLRRRFVWQIRSNGRVVRSWLLLALAILLALHYRYSPRLLAGQEQVIAFAWQTVARYFMACMVLVLFLGSETPLPSSFGLFHIAVTICTGQILLLDDLLILFRSLELLSVILVVIYAATALPRDSEPVDACGRRIIPLSGVYRLSTRSVATLILIAAANIGWIAGSLLYQHVELLNYLPLWLARQGQVMEQVTDNAASVGFTTSGRLSSMQTVLQDQDATVALTIESRIAPGYLRARAFDTYRQSEWTAHSTQVPPYYRIESNPLSAAFGGRTYTLRLNDNSYSDLEYMTIRHEFIFQDATFTPPGTVTLESPLARMQFDDDGIVYARGLTRGKSYRAGYTSRAFRSEPAGSQLRWMLSLPNQLDPRVTELASRIFAGCTTTAQKVDAVVAHFRDRYTYSLTMDIPEDQDKLMYFLLSASTGYCEYFASGSAILLRLANVPTRYVTGFYATQRGDENGAWVARNMDAHAWAEAWDEQRRCWTIVEATIQGGANTAPVETGPRQADEGLGAHLRRLAEAVYQYGLLGLVSWLFTSHSLFATSLILSILLGGVLWWFAGRLRRRYGRPDGFAAPSPRIVAMHRLLARVDRKVAAAGLRRRPTETLHAFAARVAASAPAGADPQSGSADPRLAAAWYDRYASLRYTRAVSSEELHRLQEAARPLWSRR
jgi:protein-glutamine gamma-glutamyltransferase